MKTNIYRQHEEHINWQSKIAFYRDELKIMQKRLEEISTKNTGAEVRKEIEQFQNQLIIQDRVSDDIIRHIKREENNIQEKIRENEVASDHRTAEDHTEEREMVQAFEKNFNDLRKRFKDFLAERM